MVPVQSSAGYLDPSAKADGAMASRGAVDPAMWKHHLRETMVPIDGEFFLHPGQFALAAVYEYMKLPIDLCADVVGRSSWARVGLIVAMATFVHPGYAGCLTLELQNLGQMPICLKPGLRVAQVVFRETTDSIEEDHELEKRPWPDQLACSYAPEYWEIMKKKDRDLLRDLGIGARGVQ